MPPSRKSKQSLQSELLKESLRRRNLKWNWDSIAGECVANPVQISQLLEFCTDAEVVIQQNAGAVLGKIIDLDQEVLVSHLPRILGNLKADPHDAVKRATMRVLQTIEIPESVEGEVFDLAMRFLSDFQEAIAIRAFSMTTARRLCQRYPPLRSEVLPIVREMIEQKPSTGLLSRARKELKLLEAIVIT